MDYEAARRRKWKVTTYLAKNVESHIVVTIRDISGLIKEVRKEYRERNEMMLIPLAPVEPWVIEYVFRDFKKSFRDLGLKIKSVSIERYK